MKPVRALRALAPTASLATLCAAAIAHPHVWVTSTAVAQMRGTTLVAVQEKWTFSKGFPVAMIGDLSGLPRSGPVDAKYTALFKEQAFSALRGADYFTHVFADGKRVSFAEARDFSIVIERGRITYSFVVPLLAPVDVAHAGVELGVWDDTFFVDFQPGSPPVTFDVTPTGCSVQSFEDRNHPIFGGTIFPQASRCADFFWCA